MVFENVWKANVVVVIVSVTVPIAEVVTTEVEVVGVSVDIVYVSVVVLYSVDELVVVMVVVLFNDVIALEEVVNGPSSPL